MGYCVSMDTRGCVIPAAKVADALKAINAMHDPAVVAEHGGGGRYGPGGEREKWYSWVGNPGPGGFKTLVDALAEWRYEAEVAEKDDPYNIVKAGDVVILYFNGEKLGDDEQLWTKLAPFLSPGWEVRCVGEDDSHWRWTSVNGKFEEQSGEVVYA